MLKKVFAIGVAASCSIGALALFAGHNLFFARKGPPARPAPAPAAHASAQGTNLRVPIFVYHSVRPDFPGETKWQKAFSVTPEQLEAQLAFLKQRGYTTISLDELARDMERGTTTPVERPVVLTFDDGWRNQYVYALPLLEKYRDTATFFIYTNPINANYRGFLTWDDVKALDAAGMAIGAHTISHPYLSKLSPEALRHEVEGGKKIIETHLGKPVIHFASPFGYESSELDALLQEAGFATGRSTRKGAYHDAAERYHLSAFLVHRDLRDFAWALEYSR